MQRTRGNAALARLLDPPPPPATETRVERYEFRATIRRGEPGKTSAAWHVALGPSRSDAGPGAESTEEILEGTFTQLEEAAAAAAPTPESETAAPSGGASASEPSAEGPQAAAQPGPPISVPDIEIPELAEIEKTDAVHSGFGYTSSIARGGAAPSGFGVTRSFGSKLRGILIVPLPWSYLVIGVLEHPITYQVRSGTGPASQKDIASESDSDITKTNYPTVVSDLTPNMGDLNGRPPRTKFWTEDLTLRHELVHANDDKANGPGAVSTVMAWLNTQTAASKADVQTHLTAVPARFASALLAALSTEDGEKHAYGDGAPSYTARANAVKKKGEKGDYK